MKHVVAAETYCFESVQTGLYSRTTAKACRRQACCGDICKTSVESSPSCRGMLLQLELPAEVKPSQSTAQRSNASGKLLVTMPKEYPDRAGFNVACSRSAAIGVTTLHTSLALSQALL